MASTYSTNLALELIATGEQAGQWGNSTNNNLGTLIEQAISGYVTSLTIADSNTPPTGPTTLTMDNGTSCNARNMYLQLTSTGALTADRQLIVPANKKLYFIYNNTTGGYAVTVKVSGQTGVSVPNGAKYILACNGTDIVKATSTDMAAAVGTLPITNGGTGATTLAGANIPVTNAANSFTAKQTFSGSSSVLAMVTNNIAETTTVSATAATGTIAYYVTDQSVLYYTSNASADWTPNFRASSGTALDSVMSNGQAITVVFMVTQGATAFKSTAVQVDGNAVTPKWQGGSAPTAGNASSIDVYSYTIIKTNTATFTVLASQTQFK